MRLKNGQQKEVEMTDQVKKELERVFEKVQKAEEKQELINAGLLPKPKMILYSDFVAGLKK